MSTPVRLSRRSVLTAGLAAGGLLVAPSALTACSPGSRSSGDRIRAYWWGDNTLNQAVKTVLDDFSAKNGNVKISDESGPFDGYWDKLATMVAGGNPPDLIMMAASYMPEYSSKSALLALDDYVGKELDTSALDNGIVEFGKLDGKLYGIIGATNATGLITNADILTELGVNQPTDLMEWDAFGALAQSVHDKSGGKVFGLQDSAGDLVAFTVWVRQQGIDLFDAGGKFVPTEATIAEWFTWWHQKRASGAVMPPQLTAQAAGKANASGVVTKKAALGLGWNQDMVTYAALLKSDLQIHLPPTSGDSLGNWINAASLWSGSAKSKQPDEVVKIINFLVNDSNAATNLKTTLGGPPTKKARDLIAPTLSGADKVSVEFMGKIAEQSRPLNRLWPPAFAPLRTTFTQVSEKIAFGQRSVSQGVSDFLADVAKHGAA